MQVSKAAEGERGRGYSYPVEGHVRGVLERSVVRMAHHHDVAVAGRARRTQRFERALGVGAVAR